MASSGEPRSTGAAWSGRALDTQTGGVCELRSTWNPGLLHGANGGVQHGVRVPRLLDNTGGDGADRARALITSPSGTAQHAGYEAHLNRTEFTDLVRPKPSTLGGTGHADCLAMAYCGETVAAEG